MALRWLSLVLLFVVPQPDSKLSGEIDQILQEPALKGGIQGLWIQSLRTNEVWYSRNPDTLLLPASNQKLLTSAAVLNALGTDWKYVTRIEGKVDLDGNVAGNMYLIGSGDPLLSDRDLDGMVESMKRFGVRRISGDIVGDDSRFDSVRYGDSWSWDDMTFDYQPQVSGLNLNENVVRIVPSPGKRSGERIRLTIEPSSRYVKIANTARTAGKGEMAGVIAYKELGQNSIRVFGELAVDAPAEARHEHLVPVERPALFAASVLKERLERAGIKVSGHAGTGKAPSDLREIARHESAPLSEILAKLNKPSDNLIAECLLKTLGVEKGWGGSIAAGRDVALEWFGTIGMDSAAIQMADGSGLSRMNYVTARNLGMLLRSMYTHPGFKAFYDSLPIAGVDGTSSNRMKGTPAERNVHAKSGYLSGVSSFSGYVKTADGEPLVFVILMNNHRAPNAIARVVQDKIVVLLASHGASAKPDSSLRSE